MISNTAEIKTSNEKKRVGVLTDKSLSFDVT